MLDTSLSRWIQYDGVEVGDWGYVCQYKLQHPRCLAFKLTLWCFLILNFNLSEQLPIAKSGHSCKYIINTDLATNEAMLVSHIHWPFQQFPASSHRPSRGTLLCLSTEVSAWGWYLARNSVSSILQEKAASLIQEPRPSALQVANSQGSSSRGCFSAPRTKATLRYSMQKCRYCPFGEGQCCHPLSPGPIKVCSRPKETSPIRPFLLPLISNPQKKPLPYKISLELPHPFFSISADILNINHISTAF